MSILTELLSQKETATQIMKENTEEVFAKVVSEEVLKKFDKLSDNKSNEDVLKEEAEFDIEDLTSDEDSESVDITDEPEIGEKEEDTSEVEIEDEEEVSMDSDSDTEISTDVEIDDSETENVEDLTDASFEEITSRLQSALEDLKDGETLTLKTVKNTSFDVDVEVEDEGEMAISDVESDSEDETGVDDVDSDIEYEVDMDDITGHTDEVDSEQEEEEEEVVSENKDKDDPCWDEYKQVGMKDKDGKKVPNCVKESVETDENANNELLKEQSTKFKTVLSKKNAHIKTLEEKMIKAKNAIQKLLSEVKQLKETEGKYVEILKESKSLIEEQLVTNTNLSKVMTLFLEFSTTTNEKKEIVKDFQENAQTIRESKILFESYKKLLSKSKATKKVPNIKNKEGVIIKESKSLQKDTVKSDFDRLAGIKN